MSCCPPLTLTLAWHWLFYSNVQHRLWKHVLLVISVGRFKILGGGGGGGGKAAGARFRILGGGPRGGNFNVMCPPLGFNKSVPNNYISHLNSDDIENSRIELKGIVLPVPSNQIKVTFILFYPSNLVHL